MNLTTDVLIIGGGLAGLTSALHLQQAGVNVILIEKNSYPHHKVCGEYISNEVLPYLNWLGLNISDLQPTSIAKLEFSTASGKAINCDLPLGGFGISRFILDEYLYKKALKNGCTVLKDTVESVTFESNQFIVTTAKNRILRSEIVIGAFGKRSNMDHH